MRDQLGEHIVVLRAVAILRVVPRFVFTIAADQVERRTARHDNLFANFPQGHRAIGVAERCFYYRTRPKSR